MQPSSGGTLKQFLLLGGKPVVVHTLEALASVRDLGSITVAVRDHEQERAGTLLAQYASALPKGLVLAVVGGGETRQRSVQRALDTVACEDEDLVVVHDAVRPLVEPAAIERVLAAARQHGAAILAMPATDTIKQVERIAAGALITATIPRENIVQAQTPQAARAGLLRRAVREAAADGFAGTDEASLLERAGIAVAVVAGSASNLKITQAADLPLAEWYLQRREAQRSHPEQRDEERDAR